MTAFFLVQHHGDPLQHHQMHRIKNVKEVLQITLKNVDYDDADKGFCSRDCNIDSG